MTAQDELNALLSPLPGFELLSDAMKVSALNLALVPDGLNVWPGQPGYQTTYDVYWAAISLLGFLQAQPVVRQSSSEGTSVAVDAPSWGGLIAFYRSMSRIAQATGSDTLGVITIPQGPHVERTDMSGRWGTDGDLDTDVS